MAYCQASDSISNKITNMDWGGGVSYHSRNGRFGSGSSQTSQNSADICRICHCESEPQNPLLTPCYCSGSLKYVHQSCLQQWLTASETTSCELCKFPFIMHTKIKPFNEWRALQMSGIERRRLFCSVLFHCAAATCVIWSLCVLIERATEEVKKGQISWPFWTKLVVVTVGLTGGVVFMYIQCKAYLSLCTRWRARNRILLIQNAPEKVAPPAQEMVDLRASPSLLFNRTAASVGSTGTGTPGLLSSTASGIGTAQVSMVALNRSVYSAASHAQIVANIENNSQISGCGGGSSRDWTNVYVEDMPEFHSDESGYPCSSAGDSVEPNLSHFNGHPHHQSQQSYPLQNQPSLSYMMMEGQDIASDCSPHEMCAGRLSDGSYQIQHYTQHHSVETPPNQFMANRSKFNRQRHSLWVGDTTTTTGVGIPVAAAAAAAATSQSDFRRYSDTRLICEPRDYPATEEPLRSDEYRVFNVGMPTAMGYNNNNNNSRSQSNNNSTTMIMGPKRTTMEGTAAASATSDEEAPQVTDILFASSAEHGSSFDPLELNIQELLELDIRTNVIGAMGCGAADRDFHQSSQLSVNSDPQKYFKEGQEVVHNDDEDDPNGNGTRADNDVSLLHREQREHLLTRPPPLSLPNLSASSDDLLQRHRHKDHHQF